MSTFNTDNYLAQNDARTLTIANGVVTASPTRLQAANVASGEVEFAVIPYTLAGTEAAADVVNLAVLPAGVIPVPQLSSVTCATDPGTALTLKIGTNNTTGDDDGWAAAVAMTVAGKVDCCAPSATQPAWLAATPLAPDAGSSNAVVFATVTTATALTATTVLTFTLAYKRGR